MLLILLIIAPLSTATAERTEFKSKSTKPDEQLFDYAFGWKLCVMDKKEFRKYVEEARETREKYRVRNYLQNRKPSKQHTALLEVNRDEIEKMFDIYRIEGEQGNKKRCERMKKKGLFGKQ